MQTFLCFVYRSRRNVTAAVSSGGSSGGDWRDKCRQVLEIIGNHDDSMPFREPVDPLEHPGKCILAIRFIGVLQPVFFFN